MKTIQEIFNSPSESSSTDDYPDTDIGGTAVATADPSTANSSAGFGPEDGAGRDRSGPSAASESGRYAEPVDHSTGADTAATGSEQAPVMVPVQALVDERRKRQAAEAQIIADSLTGAGKTHWNQPSQSTSAAPLLPPQAAEYPPAYQDHPDAQQFTDPAQLDPYTLTALGINPADLVDENHPDAGPSVAQMLQDGADPASIEALLQGGQDWLPTGSADSPYLPTSTTLETPDSAGMALANDGHDDRLSQLHTQLSTLNARSRHEDFGVQEAAFQRLAQIDPTLLDAMQYMPDPGEFVYRMGQRVSRLMAPDPTAGLPPLQQDQPAPEQDSLSDALSAGSAAEAAPWRPKTIHEILRPNRR